MDVGSELKLESFIFAKAFSSSTMESWEDGYLPFKLSVPRPKLSGRCGLLITKETQPQGSRSSLRINEETIKRKTYDFAAKGQEKQPLSRQVFCLLRKEAFKRLYTPIFQILAQTPFFAPLFRLIFGENSRIPRIFFFVLTFYFLLAYRHIYHKPCCDSFKWTVKALSHPYTYIHFFSKHPSYPGCPDTFSFFFFFFF